MTKMMLGRHTADLLNPQDVKLLPPNFKMPEIEKFDGSSCPRIHIQSYMMAMATKVCDEEAMAARFHLSLNRPADAWFINLKPGLRQIWEHIKAIFMEKYKGNIEWQTTRAHVMGTIQEG